MGSDSPTQRSDLRYELKMVCQEPAYERVLLRLRLDPSGIRTLHPPRQVQSVYLDTAGGRALQENLAGISHREKIRLRWYGPDSVGVKPTLERKVRENMLGWKDTLKIDGTMDVEGVDRNTFMRDLRERVTLEWRHSLDAGIEPVQWISYLRDYLTTADGKVRITIDRKLCATDLRQRYILSQSLPTPIPKVLVIEAKCGVEDFDYAQRVLSRLPLFVDRCSKFVLAATREHGPHPSVFPL